MDLALVLLRQVFQGPLPTRYITSKRFPVLVPAAAHLTVKLSPAGALNVCGATLTVPLMPRSPRPSDRYANATAENVRVKSRPGPGLPESKTLLFWWTL